MMMRGGNDWKSMYFGLIDSSLDVEPVFPDGLTKIRDYLFLGFPNLVSVSVPSGVTSIGENAFYLSGLEQIELPNGLKTIGAYAFWGTKITNIDIPNSVTTIGAACFRASTLTRLVLPDSITDVPGQILFGSPVTYVEFGNNVASIGNQAMTSCSKLKTFVIKTATPPTIGSSLISGATDYNIYVPDASVAAYKAANNWSTLASRIFPLSDLVGGVVNGLSISALMPRWERRAA